MPYRVLTVAREYGSGGAEIAALVADRLGWKLLDRNLIDHIARRAGVNVESAQACDEHVDSWLYRISKPLWHGGFPDLAALAPVEVFDADSMARLTHEIVEEAHANGNCVIVGRGAQCILRRRDDVFHVFVCAPMADRVRRIQKRLPVKEQAERLIRQIDGQRAAYVRMYFGQDWANPHLYDLMLNSRTGCTEAAASIVNAMSLVAHPAMA